MKYDDEVLLDASQVHCEWDKGYKIQHINYCLYKTIHKKLQHKYDFESYGVPEYKVESYTSKVVEATLNHLAHYDQIYGVEEIIECIGEYLHMNISDSLSSEEYFILAMAILDRRCGKRTLEKYAQYEYLIMPNWLKRIYRIRFETENIPYSECYKT